MTMPATLPALPARPRQPYSLMDPGAAFMLLILTAFFIAPACAWVEWGSTFNGEAGKALTLRMLVWSALLTLLLPVLQIAMGIRRHGGSTIRGNRDYAPQQTGVLARVSRAHVNAIESLTPFTAVVLAAQAGGVSNRWTVAASALYFASRLIHTLTYVLGVTIIRSSAFYAAWIATLTIAVSLLSCIP